MRLSYIILAIALLHTACTRSNDGVTPNMPNPPNIDSIVGTYTGLNFSPLIWRISNNGNSTGGSDYRGSVTVSKISADSIKIVFSANNGATSSSINLKFLSFYGDGNSIMYFINNARSGTPTDLTRSENLSTAFLGRGISPVDLSRVRWGVSINHNFVRYVDGRLVYQENWNAWPIGENSFLFFK
ncbi:MAG: hypothetical protein ACK4HE_10995 [Chitinophagaceae bacterium]